MCPKLNFIPYDISKIKFYHMIWQKNDDIYYSQNLILSNMVCPKLNVFPYMMFLILNFITYIYDVPGFLLSYDVPIRFLWKLSFIIYDVPKIRFYKNLISSYMVCPNLVVNPRGRKFILNDHHYDPKHPHHLIIMINIWIYS